MSIKRDAELLAPAGLPASIREAPSGAQFRSDQVCPLGLLAINCAFLPPGAMYNWLPDACGARKPRSPFDDQAKPVAPAGRGFSDPDAKSRTEERSTASTASRVPRGEPATLPRCIRIGGALADPPRGPPPSTRPWAA